MISTGTGLLADFMEKLGVSTHPELWRVTYSSSHGTITLTGVVHAAHFKQLAEDILAPFVVGKYELNNEIRVEECEPLRRHLVVYHLEPEELPAEVREQIRLHIKSCIDCKLEVQAMEQAIRNVYDDLQAD